MVLNCASAFTLLAFYLIMLLKICNLFAYSDSSPLDVLVDRASRRLYEMLVIGEHVTLKVTSQGTT